MKKNYASLMLTFLLACVSCSVAGNGGYALDASQEVVRLEMNSGEIAAYEYRRKDTFGVYVALHSESAIEKNVLVRANGIGQSVPLGRWSNIDEVQDGDVGELVDLLEKIARNKVEIDIPRNRVVVGMPDPLKVDMPKTGRKLFDASSAAKKCLKRFRTGWMPRRVTKKDAEYVLTCILPWMEDGGYFIFAASDGNVAHISRAEFYQYDRIPMQR